MKLDYKTWKQHLLYSLSCKRTKSSCEIDLDKIMHETLVIWIKNIINRLENIENKIDNLETKIEEVAAKVEDLK